MSTQDKFETINGYSSAVKKDNVFDFVFDHIQLRFARNIVTMDNGTWTKRLPEDYKEKFASLKKIVNEVPDEVLDYTIELNNEGLFFRGVTESTVCLAFALFAREHMIGKRVTMLTEKMYTFRVRDMPEEENEDNDDPGPLFPGEYGDY